jgi:hypothetical protein
MKNYIYKWQVGGGLEWREVPEDKYTERQKEHKEFIDMLSAVVKKAKCGWDEVKYKVIEYDDVFDSKSYSTFMVLCIDGHEERWIPITGNSMGCNFSVLGENLW